MHSGSFVRNVNNRVYWKSKKLRFVFNSLLLFCGWGCVTTRKKQKLNCQPGTDARSDHKIYKGNFEKYKGKIRNQYISVFGPKNNFAGYLWWLAAFLRGWQWGSIARNRRGVKSAVDQAPGTSSNFSSYVLHITRVSYHNTKDRLNEEPAESENMRKALKLSRLMTCWCC